MQPAARGATCQFGVALVGLPQQVLVGWVLFWLVGLYLVPYLLRLVGINALP